MFLNEMEKKRTNSIIYTIKDFLTAIEIEVNGTEDLKFFLTFNWEELYF